MVPHITMEVRVKFVPMTVSVRSLPPANTEVGVIEVKVGGGPTGREKLGDTALVVFFFAEVETEVAELETAVGVMLVEEREPEETRIPAEAEIEVGSEERLASVVTEIDGSLAAALGG